MTGEGRSHEKNHEALTPPAVERPVALAAARGGRWPFSSAPWPGLTSLVPATHVPPRWTAGGELRRKSLVSLRMRDYGGLRITITAKATVNRRRFQAVLPYHTVLPAQAMMSVPVRSETRGFGASNTAAF
jgi:hypothetical protein